MDLPEIETRYPWFTESFSRTASSMVDERSSTYRYPRLTAWGYVVGEAADFWIPESKGNPLPSSSGDAWTGDPTVLIGLSDDWKGYTEDGFSKTRAEFLELISMPVPNLYTDPYQMQTIARVMERAGRVVHAGFKIYDLSVDIYGNPFLPRVGIGGVMLNGGSMTPSNSTVLSVQLEAIRIYGSGIVNGPVPEEVVAFLKERLGVYVTEQYTIGMDTVYEVNLTPASMTDSINVLNGIGSTIEYPTLGNEVYSFFSTGDTLLAVFKEGYVMIQDFFADPPFGTYAAWRGVDIYRFGGIPTSIDYEFGEYETREGVVQVAEINGAQFIKSFIGIRPVAQWGDSLYGWVSDSPIDVITFDDMIYAKFGRTRSSRMSSLWSGAGSLYATARIYEGTGLDFFNGGSYSRFPGGGFRRGKMGLG